MQLCGEDRNVHIARDREPWEKSCRDSSCPPVAGPFRPFSLVSHTEAIMHVKYEFLLQSTGPLR